MVDFTGYRPSPATFLIATVVAYFTSSADQNLHPLNTPKDEVVHYG